MKVIKMIKYVNPKTKGILISNKMAYESQEGDQYPVIDAIPIFILDTPNQTMDLAHKSLLYGKKLLTDEIPGIYLSSIGVSDEEKAGILNLWHKSNNAVDPVVTFLIGATNGIGYKSLIGKLQTYPVPDLPLPTTTKESFLDLGCSWGRWSIAASQKGYQVTGIDPSLGAIAAGRRVCSRLNVKANLICGDARFLPFENDSFDIVFSYSVLQHLSKENTLLVLQEISRVLKKGGIALIQMPNMFGVRCLMHQAKRRFRKPQGFEVRYWNRSELRNSFESTIGRSVIFADCFFGLNLQGADIKLMSGLAQKATQCSELLKKLTFYYKPLIGIADSVFVKAVKS